MSALVWLRSFFIRRQQPAVRYPLLQPPRPAFVYERPSQTGKLWNDWKHDVAPVDRSRLRPIHLEPIGHPMGRIAASEDTPERPGRTATSDLWLIEDVPTMRFDRSPHTESLPDTDATVKRQAVPPQYLGRTEDIISLLSREQRKD